MYSELNCACIGLLSSIIVGSLQATYFVRKGLGFSDGSSTLYVTSAVVMDPAIHFQSGPSCGTRDHDLVLTNP